MIDRLLRRLAVHTRIVGGFLVLVVLGAIALPLIVANHSFLVSRLQQIAEVEARADRLLLLASTRIESSRVNLMRYVQDYAPSTYEAQDDVDQAFGLLTEALDLITAPEQRATVQAILEALEDYKTLITDVEVARSEGQEQNVSRILFQAYRLGNDIGARIEQVVDESEARVAAANDAIYADAGNRLILLGSVYVVVLVLALVLASLIQRSITRPVAELREGAEAFRRGDMDATVPVVGNDELTLLARTFNQMAVQSRDMITTLEQRVADRTRDLEQRAVRLATAADVGRAATSILDLATLIPRVVSLVCERFDLYYAGLFVVDDAGEYAVLAAGSGEPGRLMKERGHKLQVGGASMVGTACAQKKARVALDVVGLQPGEEPMRFDNPLLPDTRSEMALPLIVGDHVLGALDVQSTEPAAFSEEDITVLQLVADQVAVAIDNARKFSDEAALLEAANAVYHISRCLAAAATTDEIAQVILDAIAETEADGAALASFNLAQEGQLETITFLGSWDRQGASRFPIGVPIPPSARFPLELSSRFFVVEDAGRDVHLPEAVREYMSRAGMAALVNIPLHADDRTIGCIRVDRGTAGPFSPTTLELYRALADQASVALERARLLEETQRRVAQERLAASITRRIRSYTDVDTILRIALQELGHALGAADGLIQLNVSNGAAEGQRSVPSHQGSLSDDDGDGPRRRQLTGA
jgi:GAF domain-containing protein/HAMP domain-containing protein